MLGALAAGMTTEEAAAHLCIAVHTARTHVRNAIRKLGARSRLEAVMLALREGLIELPRGG
jgi:DNA-binding CsgD family transcriptional regulator